MMTVLAAIHASSQKPARCCQNNPAIMADPSTSIPIIAKAIE